MTILWEFDEKHPKQVSAYAANPLRGELLGWFSPFSDIFIARRITASLVQRLSR
jgi:hypothetical protein